MFQDLKFKKKVCLIKKKKMLNYTLIGTIKLFKPFCMCSVEVNRNILKDAGFLKVEQLTPIKKKLYYHAMKMKKRVKRIETSKTSLKTKLEIRT